MTLIQHVYKAVTIDQRPADGYINLNQMADATGKRIDNWLKNQSTKDLIAEFESLTTSNSRELNPAIVTQEGRFGGGTWAHPDIAIQFAMWCSPSFALRVSQWVRQWLTTGKRPSTHELENMTVRQLRYELQRAKNWYKLIDCHLGQIKQEAMFEAIKFEQQEMDLDEDEVS
ncbi:MAG: KilA-N domain-containing protein [Pseudanabaena sp. CRU_2_10]|nr:KilA-N domain-containing protein [Pseudanabaena sp. CRU_2_10]